MKGLATDFALILSIAAVIVIDILMRGTANRTHDIRRNDPAITSLDWSEFFLVSPEIVFEKEAVVLLMKGFDDRKLIDFEFLVLWRMGIVIGPLFERDISADKV